MTDAAETLAAAPADAARVTPTRPFYWSVRRELWEFRSLTVAPLIAAGFALLGFLISTIGMPVRRLHTLTLDPASQVAVMSEPYNSASTAVLIATVVVGLAYSLSALHNERRDRSILFWKSLPVSDLTTVLSKAAIPLLVQPAIAILVILGVHSAILLFSTLILLASGVSPAMPAAMAVTPLTLIYGVVTMSLWYAPVFAWLLLVSAWARRAPFLWALLPPVAICLFEQIAFNTHYVLGAIGAELAGGPRLAGSVMDQVDVMTFFTAPGLWLGWLFTAGCLAGAVWLRRRREPI